MRSLNPTDLKAVSVRAEPVQIRTRTGNPGANLRELMERLGHSSTWSALIYLHSTDERQRTLADALGDLA